MLEARDKASEAYARVEGRIQKLAKTTAAASEEVAAASTRIDESFLKSASGADVLDLASARVEAAQARLAAATEEQAAAEKALLDAQAKAAAASDGDTEAIKAQITASDELAAAQKRTAEATKALKEAEATQAATSEAAAAKTDAATAAQTKLADTSEASGSKLGGLGKAAGIVGIGIGVVAGASVKAAADFQTATEQLVTGAGESQKNLDAVRQGILQVATATGTSTAQLTDAMYHIESAGFHGAAGLKLLQTAAEGAKVGNADFDTVSKTLVGTMDAYRMSGGQATNMMNGLIATVGAGDMRMQDLASSLGNVAPLAAAAGISFDQIGGAVATMTSQNMSAQQATQDLANTIRSLQKPNNEAVKEMEALGLSSNDISQNLGKRGLTGTLEMLTRAVAAHTQGGQVLISTFEASKTAAADANTMIKAMPANLQKLARGFLDGSINAKDWKKDLQGLPPIQQHLMAQFAGVADKTHSFNDLLARGGPAAQTYNAAMSTLLGGATGLNTALMLTGKNTQAFNDSVTKVSQGMHQGGSQVSGWAQIQGTFNQKMDRAKAAVQSAGITIGSALLPTVTKIADVLVRVITPIATWMDKHQKLTALILTSVGAMAAVAGAIKLVSGAMGILNAVMDANPIGLIVVAIAGLVAAFIYCWHHFESFREFWIGNWRLIQTVASAVWHFLVDLVRVHVQAIEQVLHFFERLPGMFTSWLSGAASAVGNGLLQIVTWFYSLPLKINGLFADAGSWLFNAGWNIINGLWNGINGIVGQLYHYVSNIGSNIVDSFKSVLHILSPSRVMADEVGKYIPLGIAAGITEHMGAVHAAAQLVGRQAVAGAQVGFTVAGGQSAISPGLSTYPGASNAVSPTFHFDLRGAQIMNERDVHNLVEKIGRAVSTQILPAGGVKIGM